MARTPSFWKAVVAAGRLAVLSTCCALQQRIREKRGGRRERVARADLGSQGERSFASLWERPDDEFGH